MERNLFWTTILIFVPFLFSNCISVSFKNDYNENLKKRKNNYVFKYSKIPNITDSSNDENLFILSKRENTIDLQQTKKENVINKENTINTVIQTNPDIIIKDLANNTTQKEKLLTTNFSEQKSINQNYDTSADTQDAKDNIILLSNKLVTKQIKYLTETKKEFFIDSLIRAKPYIDEMKKIFREDGLPEELAYLPLIESGYKNYAVSYRGAAGMWQFMYGTAKWLGMNINQWVDERFDPIISCKYAAKFLGFLYSKFSDWHLALAAYNYGGVNLKNAMKKSKTTTFFSLVNKGGLPRETKDYVPRFIAAVTVIKNLEKYGLNKYNLDEANQKYSYVKLPFSCPLSIIDKYSIVTIKELKKYNPGLRTNILPPSNNNYTLRVPKDKKENIESHLATIKRNIYSGYVKYTIKTNDNLSTISVRYNIPISYIKQINNIKNANRIWVGQVIYLPISKTYHKKTAKKGNKNSKKIITYIVKKGDTISEIAYKYGIAADTITKSNNIMDPSLIRYGDTLKLYVYE